MRRWQHILLGIAALLLTGLMGLVGLSGEHIACWRKPGEGPACTFSHSGPLGYEKRFPPGSLATVQVFRRGPAKPGSPPSFHVALLDRHGGETSLAHTMSEAEATAERDRWAAFLTDPNHPGFAQDRQPGWWIYLLVTLGAALSIAVMAGPAVAKRVAPVSPRPTRTQRWPSVIIFVLALADLIAVVMILSKTSKRSWLEIRAENRCRFGGSEILPGGVVRMGMTPGHYSIDVWHPDLVGHWQAQDIDVVDGQTTLFLCRPNP